VVASRRRRVKLTLVIRRFFIPKIILSILYFLKFGCKISTRSEVELSPNLKIGENTTIGSFTKIKASDGLLKIGKNVSISEGCDISSGEKGITIGDDCMLGPHVNIIGNNYRYDNLEVPIREQGTTSKGVVIKSNVWIGAGSTILDGSHIGSGVIIAPNSLVSLKIPDNAIVQGNPAKVIFIRR
jgi:acetyltransferase-like isoleucine patch superfamily enzyme